MGEFLRSLDTNMVSPKDTKIVQFRTASGAVRAEIFIFYGESEYPTLETARAFWPNLEELEIDPLDTVRRASQGWVAVAGQSPTEFFRGAWDNLGTEDILLLEKIERQVEEWGELIRPFPRRRLAENTLTWSLSEARRLAHLVCQGAEPSSTIYSKSLLWKMIQEAQAEQ